MPCKLFSPLCFSRRFIYSQNALHLWRLATADEGQVAEAGGEDEEDGDAGDARAAEAEAKTSDARGDQKVRGSVALCCLLPKQNVKGPTSTDWKLETTELCYKRMASHMKATLLVFSCKCYIHNCVK